MTTNFRVVDVRTQAERMVESSSPEPAARQVLEQDVVRSGWPNHLIARVYWQLGSDAMNMVHLYERVSDQ